MSVCLVHWFTCPWPLAPSPARLPRGPSPASHRMIPVASIPISEHPAATAGGREAASLNKPSLARPSSFSP